MIFDLAGDFADVLAAMPTVFRRACRPFSTM